jgi:hypothetical protein
MYPEYAGRTLNAYCWALDKTGDPRYLAALERTWEATLDNGGAVITGSYASRFPHYGAKHGLFPAVPDPVQAMPDLQTWQFQRLSGGSRDLYFRQNNPGASIMVILEDIASGEARLLDASGTVIGHHVFDSQDTPFQTGVFTLPESGTVFRLLLSGGDEKAWQVHHDAAISMMAFDPDGSIAPDLTPRGYAHTVDGADRVALVLHAEGEGYHSGELYDPQGRLAAVVRTFIAHDDASRYEMMLAAPVDESPGVWSVRLHRSAVVRTHGLMPYWAASEGEWFDPERAMTYPAP